jgi:hypothetical protein
MTYFEDGTASLSAAYDLAGGSVIAQHYRRHRHQEFLRFLKLTGAAVPRDLDLHLILDNYATCKTPDPPASPSPAHPHHRQPTAARIGIRSAALASPVRLEFAAS